MFSVRQTPWHGLGVVIDDIATWAEAHEIAGLNWEVEKVPAYARIGDCNFAAVPRGYVTVRTDTQQPLGQVGAAYTPLQNADAFKFMDAVCADPGGPKYVTAGSLHGGRKIWMLVKMPSFVELTNSDIVEEFLLLSNTHDGSRAIEVLWTPIRVVCQNTLTAALKGTGKGRVSLRHMPNIRAKVADVQDILGISRENHLNFSAIAQALQSYEPSQDEVNDVLKTLFAPDVKTNGDTRYENIARQVESLYRDGEANANAGDTWSAWALYNGITEYADHYRPTRVRKGVNAADVRLESNWYGSGAELKSRALEVVAGLL